MSALPAPDAPHLTLVSNPHAATDVVPRAHLQRRRRPDPAEEFEELRRELEETQARETHREMNLAERAYAFATHERLETRAALNSMQTEANASIARVQEVALGYEQEARKSLHGEQVGVTRLREIEHAAQSQLASQQAQMAEAVTGRERAFASQQAMVMQEMHAMRDDRDRQFAEALNSQREAEELRAEMRRIAERSDAESADLRRQVADLHGLMAQFMSCVGKQVGPSQRQGMQNPPLQEGMQYPPQAGPGLFSGSKTPPQTAETGDS